MKVWTRSVLIAVLGIVLISGCGDTQNTAATEAPASAEDTPSYPDWMSQNPMVQNASLSEIAIPGAHDAGMGKITECSAYARAVVTQTQDKSFAEMLDAGIRYFDIRAIIDKKDAMRIGHFQWIGKELYMKTYIDDALDDLGKIISHWVTNGIKKLIHKTHFYNDAIGLRNEGCYGYDMDTMLDDVNTFMQNARHEVVILDLSHFMNFNKFDDNESHFEEEDVNRLANIIEAKIGRYLIKDPVDLANTPVEILTENGPKVIVIFSDGSYHDNYEGIYPDSAMNIYNQYSNTMFFPIMKPDQFEKSRTYSEDRNFLLSWTLTLEQNQSIGCMLEAYIREVPLPYLFGDEKKFKDEIIKNIESTDYYCLSLGYIAGKANSHMDEIPNDSSEGDPNIVFFDYVSHHVTSKAIAMNGNRLHYKWVTTDAYIGGSFGMDSQGGGIAMGDTDGDGTPNLVIFTIDHPGGENVGYYRVSANLENGLFSSWGDPVAIPGWFGEESQGGGIAIGDTDGDGIPNLVAFTIDNPTGKNRGYYRISTNLQNGQVASWGDPVAIPGWFGNDSQGGGITIGDTDGDGIPNLVAFTIDNPVGENRGYYRVSANLQNGQVASWGDPVAIPGWFGEESQGGGITIGDTDGDGIPNLVAYHINNPVGENRGFYRVSANFKDGQVPSWGAPTGIPGWFGSESQGGGITMGDTDGDGIPDLIKFTIDHPSTGNHGHYGIGISLRQ